MILCFSQHHTGTWTSLSWLNSHQDIKGFLLEPHVNEVLGGAEDIVHPMESGTYPEKFHPMLVYHEHLKAEYADATGDRFRLCPAQMVMMATHATLIPIRDPLAALVTYQRFAEQNGGIDLGGGLNPGFSPRAHVNTWCALAASFDTMMRFAHIRFVCWDRLPREEMAVYLEGVARDLGLKDRRPAKAWAQHEIRDNASGEYPLKAAYLAQSSNRLRKGIAENGYNYLVSKGLQLRPFLEALGYRNLQWWS